jgi:hypothetical protein
VARLEKAYQAELRLLDRQTKNLERSTQFGTKVSELIARLGERGLDTTPLEEALAAYQEKLVLANQAHEVAAEILATHTGFDEDGKVIDLQAARETVKQAGQGLLEARQAIRQSFVSLRQALREFREANPQDNNTQ